MCDEQNTKRLARWSWKLIIRRLCNYDLNELIVKIIKYLMHTPSVKSDQILIEKMI